MDRLKPSPPNSTPLSPIGFLERAATVYADCPSIIYNSITYAWIQTYTRCLKIASSISSMGINKGDVVSVLAPNIPAMYELQYAIPMSGAILNNIILRLDSRMISVILRHAQSKLVFVDFELESLIFEAIDLFPPGFDCPLLAFISDYSMRSPSKNGFHGIYEDMVLNGDSNFNWVRPKTEFEPLTLSYTSGTTSAPKGVVNTDRGSYIVSMDSLIEWSVPKEPVYLWTLPMFHTNGWSYVWGMAAVGGTNVCLRKFNAASVYAAIRKHDVTHLCGAPVVLIMLSNVLDCKPLEKPVSILTAGSSPPAAVLLRVESLGFIVSHAYGLTETSGIVVWCTWKKKWNNLQPTDKANMKARQGVKTPGVSQVDVIEPRSGKCVNYDGKSLGEIVVRGCSVMLGYLHDPSGTLKCMKDGWLYTGDIGVMHPDGYVEIKDRSKDMIISGGENFSSVEVESVLYIHPAVKEAAVVARQDECYGEIPCAFLSINEGVKQKPTENDVMEFCRENMPRYVVPKMVVFIKDLPKSATGKIQKFLLREMAKDKGSFKGKQSVEHSIKTSVDKSVLNDKCQMPNAKCQMPQVNSFSKYSLGGVGRRNMSYCLLFLKKVLQY